MGVWKYAEQPTEAEGRALVKAKKRAIIRLPRKAPKAAKAVRSRRSPR